MEIKRKVFLLILDGFGYSEKKDGNAIAQANLPNYDSLIKSFPNTLLNASGEYVGLPEGIMGNSEVGHENISAGRVNKQKLTMISDLIKDGSFFENPELVKACQHAESGSSRIHFMGLISEGDVHAHLGHLSALIKMAKNFSIAPEKIFLHAITDGRDDAPRAAFSILERYKKEINIGTMAGRYYAMDRDNNWDRIEKYLDCVLRGNGIKNFSDPLEALEDAYKTADDGKNPIGNSDEFILPYLLNSDSLIRENDSVIFFNFRPDRARQISLKIGQEAGFKNLHYLCFTEYARELNLPIAFSENNLPKQNYKNSLGETLSNFGLNQLRIAETEKYNHVTNFFNQSRKEPFTMEERVLIPSPKVATYNLKPEMSVFEITETLKEKIKNNYSLIVCNFANPDMVGHTGDIPATIKGLEAVDKCLGEVKKICEENNYLLLVTADHGNADSMRDAENKPKTSHSTNPVPFIICDENISLKTFDPKEKNILLANKLSDIAPTILELMGLAVPEEMTAKTLVK